MDKLILQNQGASINSKLIYIQIEKCQEADLSEEQGVCANKTEMDDYFGALSLEVT